MWSFFSRDPAKDFAYEIGEKVPDLEDKSLWTLHEAKHKVQSVSFRNVDIISGLSDVVGRATGHLIKFRHGSTTFSC